MPKVVCSGCNAQLNVPDKAAGKTIACPKCSEKIRVPAATASASAKGDGGGLDFGKLDLDRLQNQTSAEEVPGVCPYCAADMNPEDPVCRKCGMNSQTGQMDRAEQRRRSIKGADPREFYANAWTVAWRFTLENFQLCVRTGLFWWLFAIINTIASYQAFVFCKTTPTQTFWTGIMLMSASGIPGWWLFVTLKIVFSSYVTKEPFKQERVQFDFFQSIAAGTRTVFWPLVVIGPVLPVALCFYLFLLVTGNSAAFDTQTLFVALGVIFFLPILVLPIAIVHMTAKHTYKAWILWELLVIFVKNVGATLYLLVICAIMFLPVAAVAGGIFHLIGAMNPLVSEVLVGAPAADDKFTPGLTGNITLWLMKVAELGQAQDSVSYIGIKSIINVIATAIVTFPIMFIAAFPAIFTSKVIGLYAYYQHPALDLVQRIIPGTPATFWVRYLAHTVDKLFMPFTSFLITSNPKAFMGLWFVNGIALLIYFFSPQLLLVALIIVPAYTSWVYWVVQESSQLRSTLGKDTFGLVVENEDGTALTPQQATFKWFLREYWIFSFGLPFLWAAFHPEKKTLHDLVTRTRVTFKGDR